MRRWAPGGRLGARLALVAAAGLLAPLAGSAQAPSKTQDPAAKPAAPAEPPLKLWSRRPAVLDAPEPGVLPPFHSGNDSVGLLVSGSVEHERIRLLEPELPSFPSLPVKPLDEVAVLPRLRERLAAGRYGDVVKLAEKELLSGTEARFAPQVLCELEIEYQPTAKVENYRRELDLRTGVITITWQEGTVRHTRTLHADRMSSLIWLRWKAEGADGIPTTFRFAPHADGTATLSNHDYFLKGQVGLRTRKASRRGAYFQALANVSHWGDRANRAFSFPKGKDAEWNTPRLDLLFSGGVGKLPEDAYDRAITRVAMRFGWGELPVHLKFQAPRMAGDSLGTDLPGRQDLPTDERLEAVRKGAEDPALAGLLYQYARYLKHASSLGARPPQFLPKPPATARK